MRRLIAVLGLALVMLGAALAEAAVTVTGTPTSTSSVAGDGGITIASHTVNSGADLLVVVCGGGDGTPADSVMTDVTWNTTEALTRIAGFYKDDANFVAIDAWYRLAPTAATGSIVAHTTGLTEQLGCGAINFTGAHQTTTFGTPANASGSSATASVGVTSAAGDLVICGLMSDSQGATTPTGTQIFEVENIGGDTNFAAQSYAGGSVTCQWSQNNTGWAIAGVAVKPAGAGGATTQRLMLMGVGK